MPLQLSVQVRNAELVKKKLENLRADLPKIAEGRLWGRMEAARKKLAQEPEPFKGPYPWVSEKQRRYVMWAIKTGVIKVPYVRTHKYSEGWRIVRLKDGYMLMNPMPCAKWVAGNAYGQPQARIHQGRWAPLRDTMEEVMQAAPKEVQAAIVMVKRREGFQ